MTARVAVAALATGLALVGSAVAQPSTSLRITVWPDGKTDGSTVRTLRCNPLGGTLPNRAKACRTLATLPAPFAPVPRGAVCTAINGGPAVAFVHGTFRGRRIAAWFDRSNGCEIARWDRIRVLLPASVSAR